MGWSGRKGGIGGLCEFLVRKRSLGAVSVLLVNSKTDSETLFPDYITLPNLGGAVT